MSAAVAASPKRAHDLHTPPSLAKPAKKTLRSSLQETLRSAAGHVHVRTTNKERDAAPLDSTVGVAGGQGLTTSTTADMTRTTSRAVHHTNNNNPSSPAINHQSRNPPRPPSRTATASPALSTSTTHSTSTAILSNPRLSPSPEPPADHDKTARGGKFLKLFTGNKSRLSSVNLRGDRARDRDTKKKDGEATFRAGAGFQAPTLRAGTLSDPALHTLARREKHQPLLSLAAAFDPSSTAQRGASKPPTTSSPASAAKGTVAGRRPSISTVTATTPNTSTPSRPTNASTTSLAASTRDRSESRASSRPPTTGPRGTGASAARPTSPTPTPSSPSKLASKRPPVSGISRSRLTSPSSPSLVQSSAEPIVSNDASRMRSTSRAGAVSPTPPPITKRSSVRKSVDEKQPGELAPSTAPTSAKIDTEGATIRRRSSSATRSSVSPTTPSSYKTAQSTQPHRSSLTSASTSNLPLSSTSSSHAGSTRAPTPTSPRRSATPVTAPLTSSTSTPQKKRASLDTPTSPESPSSPQRRSSNSQARPAPPLPPSQNSSKSSEEAATARAAIRAAISFIVRESSTPPYELMQSTSPLLSRQWLQEMEVRTRGLTKLTKKWGDGERTVGADDDEKERKMFCDALRDGYILCQLLNKWRPDTISKIDHREDGIAKATNISNFAAATRELLDETSSSDPKNNNANLPMCSKEDFALCTASSMTRVANVVLALQAVVESGVLEGSGRRSVSPAPVSSPAPPPARSPRRPSVTNATAQKPSLRVSGDDSSRPGSPSSIVGSAPWFESGTTQVWAGSAAQQAALRGTRRGSGPSASTPNLLLPPTPPTSSSRAKQDATQLKPNPAPIPILTGRRVSGGAIPNASTTSLASSSVLMEPSLSSPSPRTATRSDATPQGSQPIQVKKHTSMPPPSPSSPSASSPRFPSKQSVSGIPPSHRVSIASSTTTTTTTSSATTADSLFDSNYSLRSGLGGAASRYDKFGSIRTNFTVPSTGVPSLSRSEARDAAKNIALMEEFEDPAGNDSSDTIHSLVPISPPQSGTKRDRRSSDIASDLVRVVEEDEVAPGAPRRPLRPLMIPSSSGGVPSSPSRPSLGTPIRSSPAHIHPNGHYADVFEEDDEAPPTIIQLGTPSRERPFPYSSPSHMVRANSRTRDQWTGRLDRESSPSPARLASTSSGISSSPSRRTSGRLIPRNRMSGSTGNGDMLSLANESTSSLAESSITPSPLLPAASTPSGSGPIPFPRRQSNDSLIRGGKPALARVSSSPTKKASIPESTSAEAMPPPPPTTRSGAPRSRILSDTAGDSSQRIRMDRVMSDSTNDVKFGRRGRFESMVDVSTTANGGVGGLETAVRRTLIVKEAGQPAVQYQLGNCIGRGQFGSVYRALNMTTGQVVAVKQIRLAGLPEPEVTQLMQEVELMKRLDHPSIVKYEGMSRDKDALSIVLEYAENGSLGQTLKAFGKLNERLVAGYVAKILEGLHYLHQSEVVHCDMKAANILTTKNGNIKLSDFGVSLNLRAVAQIKNDVAGTPNWMAPEVIELNGASPASDIWSLGCTVIELLTGKPPYADIPNGLSVMYRIVDDASPPLPANCSDALKDFFSQCFHRDPSKRPSAEELFEHPWLKDTWVELKDLRPQDSVPFLRRVSTDLQQRQALAHQISFSQPTSTPVPEPGAKGDTPEFDIPRPNHLFVKTAFSQAVDCRVCWTSVKKSAVFCQSCSLVCHSRCIMEAPICDMQQQARAFAEHTQRQAASPSPSPAEPRGRKVSTTKRIAAMGLGLGTSASQARISPPTSFPTISGWRKNRNSSSSMASTDATEATSLPMTPQASGHHARSPSSDSNFSNHLGRSLRSNGSNGSSGSGTQGSGSAFQSSSDGSQAARQEAARQAFAAASANASHDPAGSDASDSFPRSAVAPATEDVKNSPSAPAGSPSRLKRKAKQNGDESGSACLMQ